MDPETTTTVAAPETKNIAEATDGKGAAPKLIRADQNKPKIEAKADGKAGPAKGAESKSKPEVKPATEVASPNFGFDEIEKLLGDSGEKAPDEEDFELDEDLAEIDGEKPEGRFNKTVRHLRKRAQAAEQQLHGFQSELQKRDQMLAIMQRDLEHQRETFQTEFQRLQQGLLPKSPDEMPLDPQDPDYAVKKFERQLLEKAQAKLEGKFDPYKTELEQLKSELRRRDEEAKAKTTRAMYNQYANRAASELTTGFEPERAGRLNKALGEMLLTAAYSWKTDPRTASKVLDRVMTDYVLGKLRLRASSNKPVVDNAGLPTPPPVGRGAANPRGGAIPSREEARTSGFKDELEAMISRDGMIQRS
jgi:hypothetical protein